MNKQHRILGIRHTLLAGTFLIWLMIFIIQKPLFLAYNHDLYVGIGFKDILSIMSYGLFHDVSVAAYLTVIPGLLILCTFFTSHKVICWFMRAYFILIALTASAVFVVHTSLYAYWRFPLDATPLFYFLSSPADAFASITPMQILLSVAAWLLFASLILASFLPIIVRPLDNRLSHATAKQPIGFIILLAALFLPMRGSLTVAPVNTGKVFFSQEMAYNHAAVNPIFSVMESLSRTQNFAEQYRFMDDATAHRHFRSLTDASLRDNNTVSTFADSLFRNRRPDILLVILESFSSHLFPSLGGEKIAIKLDAFVPEGILFTRFYANSFRTDRGLLAILSGYPAQPTMSLMKYPSKTAKLPSLAMSLKRAGYGTAYYYGGDADFTNMRSYLYASGMDKIIEDVDFPIEERLSKWGVHDHLVFERLLKDMKEENPSRPMFRIIQTSSSHEPFEVPYHAYSDERVNAFAYTDSVVASALQRLRNTPRWKNLLVVIVADHQGCYPTNLSNYSPQRYHIPLLMVGGAVRKAAKINIIGSQQDLAATLLAQLHLPHKAFRFSKNMLDRRSPHFAFFTVPDAFGFLTDSTGVVYDNPSGKITYRRGRSNIRKALIKGQAYLQSVYDDIANR